MAVGKPALAGVRELLYYLHAVTWRNVRGNRVGFQEIDCMLTTGHRGIHCLDPACSEGGLSSCQRQAPQQEGRLWRLAATGGEGGIRTRGGVTLTRFPIVRIRPDYATSPRTGSPDYYTIVASARQIHLLMTVSASTSYTPKHLGCNLPRLKLSGFAQKGVQGLAKMGGI